MLAQAEPLPELLLQSASDAVVDSALVGWGPKGDAFGPAMRATCARPLRDPAHAHAIYEEYRAAASCDRDHSSDCDAGRRIACPSLALWSACGPLDTCADDGGPLALWKPWCDALQGQSLHGGHFFPETQPDATARALGDFFSADWARACR
jgi:haloacetate dehalogenase